MIQAVHLDLLTAVDSDAFPMALRGFTAHHGRALLQSKLYSDNGAERKLATAFVVMHPYLKELLAKYHRIEFHFNPLQHHISELHGNARFVL